MTAVPPVPTFVAPSGWGGWLSQLARAVNLLTRGKDNSTATVTLTPNTISTTLVDERIGAFSVVMLEAQTATAAVARSGGLYVSPESGQVVIRHPNSPATDMTFAVLIRG